MVNSRVIANRVVGVGNGVASGGGLSFYDVQVNLVTDTLQSNAAVGGSTVTNASFGQASGGAVAINEQSGQSTTVTDSKFLGNKATTATVNQTYAQHGSNDASLGGAIANEGGSLMILGGSFIGNRATGGAGLALSQGANGQGGAIFSIGTVPFVNTGLAPQVPQPPNSFVSATGVRFRKNLATGGPGAAKLSPTSPSPIGGAGQGARSIMRHTARSISAPARSSLTGRPVPVKAKDAAAGSLSPRSL